MDTDGSRWVGRALALLVIAGVGAGGIWVFALRDSNLAMRSPSGDYRMPVPRTYFLRGEQRLVVAQPAGSPIEVTVITAEPVGGGIFGYGLAHIPRSAVVPLGRTPDEILGDICRETGEGMGLTARNLEDADLGTYPGRMIRVRGHLQGAAVEGRIRTVLVEDDVVVGFMICTFPTCGNDPDKLEHIGGLTFTPAQ